MGFLIGLLTFLLVINCLVLILLVLVQLPKKEAGAGLAFGGSATDALFGAGTGTVLTRITKYAATVFFVLAVGLGLLQSAYHRRTTREFEQQMQTQGVLPGLPASVGTVAAPPSPASPPPGSSALPGGTPSAPTPGTNPVPGTNP